MSVTTNIVQKLKQFCYNAGDNAAAVHTATEALSDMIVAVRVPNGTDGNAYTAAENSSVTLTMPVDCKLQSAYFCTTAVCDSTAGNTKTLTVNTNGWTAVSFYSDALAANAAVNSVMTLTTNTINSYVDAGEAVVVEYKNQTVGSNALMGTLVLSFRRQ